MSCLLIIPPKLPRSNEEATKSFRASVIEQVDPHNPTGLTSVGCIHAGHSAFLLSLKLYFCSQIDQGGVEKLRIRYDSEEWVHTQVTSQSNLLGSLLGSLLDVRRSVLALLIRSSIFSLPASSNLLRGGSRMLMLASRGWLN
jgi:hypothetical protein